MPQIPPPVPVHAPFRSPSRTPLVVLGLAAVGAAGIAYWQYSARTEAVAAVADAKQELKKEKAKSAALEAEKAALEAEKGQLESDKAGLEAAKAELSKSVQVKEDELAALKGTYDKFREKMKDEIAHGDIHLEQTGGKLRVGLVDKLLFDPGEAEISKRGEQVLLRLAEVLAGIPDKQVQVSGHTDRTPITGKLVERYPTNWELSTARATQVVRFLAEKADVPAQRLVATGHGEYQPIASNKTPAGRARNRRIEILLTPLLAPKTIAKSKLMAAVERRAAKESDKAGDKKAGKKPEADKPADKGGKKKSK
jgi:chemotaxis protein MotB